LAASSRGDGFSLLFEDAEERGVVGLERPDLDDVVEMESSLSVALSVSTATAAGRAGLVNLNAAGLVFKGEGSCLSTVGVRPVDLTLKERMLA
jgi:hypothetical protein